MKFKHRSIWELPRAGNQAAESKFMVKRAQNHQTLRKSKNRENQPKTSGFIDFWCSNTHFRSADAANYLNARRREEI